MTAARSAARESRSRADTLAGLAAARALNKAVDDGALRQAAADLHRALQFQQALWQIFKAPPVSLQALPDDTIACRCEEISIGQLRNAIGQGYDSLAALKRMTRLGMGRCQGRYCACSVAKLLHERTGRAPLPEQCLHRGCPPNPFGRCLAFESPSGEAQAFDHANLARPADTGRCRGSRPTSS